MREEPLGVIESRAEAVTPASQPLRTGQSGSTDRVGPWMRTILTGSGLMNMSASIFFFPPFVEVRRSLGLPADPHPYYLWLLAGMVLSVGCGYLYIGVTGRPDRTLLGVAAAGKAVFGGLMVLFALRGELPMQAARSGAPDLILAGVFLGWLLRTAPRR